MNRILCSWSDLSFKQKIAQSHPNKVVLLYADFKKCGQDSVYDQISVELKNKCFGKC